MGNNCFRKLIHLTENQTKTKNSKQTNKKDTFAKGREKQRRKEQNFYKKI